MKHTVERVHPVELVVCLLIVLVVLVTAAQRLNVSYPIVLVIGGLVLALFPGLPEVRLKPDIVFLVFLPPLLYGDARNSSWRDFYENWWPIALLAIALHRAERFKGAREACRDNPEARYVANLVSLDRELIRVQRATLIDLRDRGAISDEVLRRFQVMLDLEESQLEEEQRT